MFKYDVVCLLKPGAAVKGFAINELLAPHLTFARAVPSW